MSKPEISVPYGFCQCGCGNRTGVSSRNNSYYGWVKGRHFDFLQGHNRNTKAGSANLMPPNPTGLCMCGCGEVTPLARENNASKAHVRGEPISYVNGHNRRKYGFGYREEDRGFRTPCWIWCGKLDVKGYGTLDVKRDGKYTSEYAHIESWKRRHGPVPPGLELDHLCRQPPCCNPDHLEAVTHTENMRRGASSKLTLEHARRIRCLYATGAFTYDVLAEEFGVTKTAIYCVIKERTWREAA